MPTLSETIIESFQIGRGKERFGKNKRDREKIAESLIIWFRNYYGGKTCQVDVLENCINNIKTDEFLFNIKEGFLSYANDKYTVLLRIEHLFKYLSSQFDIIIDAEVFQNLKWRNQEERLLKLFKYLHEGEHSREEIAYEFCISRRTLEDDLALMQDGFDFLGTMIKVDSIKRLENSYGSLIHPLFLASNTSEIFSLTIGLKMISKGTIFESAYNRIADQTYSQLSNKAKQIIDIQAKQYNVCFSNIEGKFINTYELMQQNKIDFSYYLRENTLCKVIFNLNGIKTELVGNMRIIENRFNCIQLIGEGFSKEIYIRDIVAVEKL